jgi:hypothetical protein
VRGEVAASDNTMPALDINVFGPQFQSEFFGVFGVVGTFKRALRRKNPSMT